MKIHILGGSGFIGGHIGEKLSAAGDIHPVLYSSKSCNLLDPTQTTSTLNSFAKDDAILLASASFKKDFSAVEENLLMARTITEALASTPVRHLIYLSSVDVYGRVESGSVINEALPPYPANPYGLGKLAAEYWLGQELCRLDIPLTVLRLPGIYGPGDSQRSVVGKMVKCGMDGYITVNGKGEARRDFVCADDLPGIISLALSKRITGTYNIATGRSISINMLAEIMAGLLGCKIRYADEEPPMRDFDLIFDTSKLRKCFDNIELTGIEEGARRYINQASVKE
ncbi:MAG: NAD(P)-dependent oxidoreductase [Planctomycetes bacterium]|nr:NAD(P)-dependent oxidoreductase [Planctomycetota bacterium]